MAKNNIKRLAWFMSFMGRQQYGVTKREIDDAWVRAGFAEGIKPVEDHGYYRKILPRATFYRLIEAAYDIFGVIISCKDGTWRIENDSQLLVRYTKQMLSSLSVMGLINQNGDLRKRILLEDVPSGYQNLEPIMLALQDRKIIELLYAPISESIVIDQATAKPFGLKLYNRRWYLIGEMTEESRKDHLKRIEDKRAKGDNYLSELEMQAGKSLFVLALDDIAEVKVTDNKFKMPEIELEAHFADFVGAKVEDNVDKQKIVIHAYGDTGSEIYSLPIHPSQKYLRQLIPDAISLEYEAFMKYLSSHSDDYPFIYEFEYELRPTKDFYRELLKYGCGIRVVAPECVKEKLQQEASLMCQLYLNPPETNPKIPYHDNKNSPLF